jgi:geranylgeranyl reductase family protein
MNRASYDVVVVGAGPSGSAAAITAARAGLSTLIVDQAEFPRDIPCGGLLSAPSMTLLKTLLDDSVIDRIVRSCNNGCRLFHNGRLIAEVQNSELVYAVPRRELDLQLLRAAQTAGCDVREGPRVVQIDGQGSAVTLASGEKIRGRSIVAADGTRSIIARAKPARGVLRSRDLGFGLMAEISVEELKDEQERRLLTAAPNIFFGVVPWGYGWIFPNGEMLNVGVGRFSGAPAGLREAFRNLVDAHFRAGTIDRIKVRGRVLPSGRPQRHPGRANVLAVGDAAGFVESLTGEGIVHALQSGILAAQAIGEALARGNPLAAGALYNAMLRGPVIKPLRQAAVARWLFYPRFCFPLAMRGLRAHAEFSRWYWELLAGKITYAQFFGRMPTVFW